MIMESFQVEKYMDEHMDSSGYLLKVTKYKGPQTIEKQVGLKAHTDISMLTILYQNEVNGFGVQSSTGEWIEWEPSKHSFIVVIGECLHASMVEWAIEGHLSPCDAGRRQAEVLHWTVFVPKTRLHDKGTRGARG
ncbi:hypothetical protein F3Y22_tig00004742pilonHSYRG00015 [Hibiscus syriacus]|uniref:Isopenicillin N synthase-like Fe(2+) 2OG dioxygenase domain-containing protein n=1 Tax=Hibiscus syriacus TaxID=106335 RepID=A0A6A3CG05_HIBSY|nr:hypothetical protein F3Y22_tig00004742pilonHSYRG00015 [Hibiscus syriacus]